MPRKCQGNQYALSEYDNQLINAIRLDGDGYVVRFCDLAPRDIASIYDDVKTTTTTPIPVTYPFTPNAKAFSKYRKVEKSQQRVVTPSGNNFPPSSLAPIYTPARTPVFPTTSGRFPTLVPDTTPVGRISMGRMFDNGKDLEKMLINSEDAADITSPVMVSKSPELSSTSGTSRTPSTVSFRGTPPYLGSGRSNEFYDDGEDGVELDMSTLAASSIDPRLHTSFKDISRSPQVPMSTPIVSQPEEEPQPVMEEGNSIEAMGSEEYEDEELTPEPVNTAPTVGSPTSGTPRTSTTETSRTAAIKELEEELSSSTMAKTERTTTRSQPHEEAVDDIAMGL
ncbi:hypothetical protein OESDEN_06763 [Oesophagostomum dentatum]|uniref:Uncharacterized protein n=1 Tax=Oesophagostomum dentatum TaxID=61180 RepID=A0A0B1T6Y9_OESDE|nr:hypothetical protein OESDEN_06763 [Oesophagostomum dentatum]